MTLNRPDRLNALDTSLTRALLAALEDASLDNAVRAIVLTGAGKGFCAGADLGEFKDLTAQNSALVLERAALSARMYAQLRRAPKPIIAAVHGAAVGGGAGLALGADMLVVSSDVKFGFPEVKHSIVPALVMSFLKGQVGPKLGFELISTGRLLGADDLRTLGLANRVAAPDKVVETALDVASTWADAAPRALAAAKDLFYRVCDLPFDSAMAAGRDVNSLMRSFRDAR